MERQRRGRRCHGAAARRHDRGPCQQQARPGLVVAGGVGANRRLREALLRQAEEMSGRVFFPALEYCTDNGAMIAYAGALRLARGERAPLEINTRARWPMDGLAN